MQVVWLKRDLRLDDHAPLKAAIENATATLLLYVFEPSLITQPQYSERHWRFVWQSLADLNQRLKLNDIQIHIAYSEVVPLLDELNSIVKIQNSLSNAAERNRSYSQIGS